MKKKKKSFYNEKQKKKKIYGTEAKGYCPFEQAGGARRWLGALGAQQALPWRAGRAGVARGRGAGALGGMGAGALGGTGARAWRAGVALGRWAAWALGRWAARAQARGALERAGGRRADGGVRGSRRGRARSVRGRAGWAAGARPGRWARGLGAWAGLGLCTRCTRPIFDPF